MIIPSLLRAPCFSCAGYPVSCHPLPVTISLCDFPTALIALVFLAASAVAQDAGKPQPEPKSVTVPVTLDHNRVVIDVYLPLSDGSTKRVRGWVDTGDPELQMSQRMAKLMGLAITCDANICSAPSPREIMIGAMKISLAALKEVRIPLKPGSAASVMVPGMSAEIKIPSSVLRNYDVLINFPDREFSIGLPGSLNFKGVKSKMLVNASGFIQIPSKIANKNYSLGLDVGSSISFLSEELFDKLAAAHPEWPRMTGAVGPANMGELGDDEPKWKLMRVDRLQYGPLYLTDVAVADFPKNFSAFFEKDAGSAIAGLRRRRRPDELPHRPRLCPLDGLFRYRQYLQVSRVRRRRPHPSPRRRHPLHHPRRRRFRRQALGPRRSSRRSSRRRGWHPCPRLHPGTSLVSARRLARPGTQADHRARGKQFTVVAKVQHFLGERRATSKRRKSRQENTLDSMNATY